MSWKNILVACAATVIVSSLNAANYCDPCDPCDPCPSDCGIDLCCDPCEGWSVHADWLYWRTRRCDLVYAVNANVINNGETITLNSFTNEHSVCPKWDSGFRVGVLKECGDVDFGVHYTHFHTEDKSKVTSSNLETDQPGVLLVMPNFSTSALQDALKNTNGLSTHFASGKYEIDYDVVDVEIGYDLNMGTCSQIRAFAGFKYASINQEFNRFYSDVQAPSDLDNYAKIRSEVDLDAYGLYIGADASFTFCDCFDFFGSFSYGALAGEFDGKYVYTSYNLLNSSLDTLGSFHSDCWKLVSNLNLSVGLEYTLSNCFCADWAVAVGYEFHQWFCMEEFPDYKLDFDNYEVDLFGKDDTCLGLDGLFVRVSASF